MTEQEKCQQGLLYDANYDPELLAQRDRCKDLCHQFNQTLPSNHQAQQEILSQLLGSMGQNPVITAPFQCDYGTNITLGDDFYANHNLIILDGAKVTFGNHIFIAPNCCISTAGHPLDAERRNQGLEYAHPITIEDNVWIGANVTILPGVTIGHDTVVAAGSVVNKSLPPNCIAVGNPCRMLRELTEADCTKGS